jgi:hypothetical protein
MSASINLHGGEGCDFTAGARRITGDPDFVSLDIHVSFDIHGERAYVSLLDVTPAGLDSLTEAIADARAKLAQIAAGA